MQQIDAFSNQIKTEQLNQIKNNINNALSGFDDEVKLNVFRDVMIDQIHSIIDKFPEHVRKEMLAIVVNKYLSEWNK